MLIVNLPGSWSYQYSHFKHASWNGFQSADLVFPLFLWIVGFGISFSERNGTGFLFHWKKAIIRTCIFILLGLFLNLFPKFLWETFRVPGVLQRIGTVYLLTIALLYLFGIRRSVYFSLGSLVIYTFLIWGTIPSNGNIVLNLDFPDLNPKNNWASVTDHLLFGTHVWKETSPLDPEGLLSTLPALSTSLFGFYFGFFVQNQNRDSSVQIKMVLSSVLLLASGVFLSYLIPLNKTLWSVSFVFLTAGISQLLYCLLEFTKTYNHPIAGWLSLYGKHALFVFVFSGIVARLSVYSVVRNVLFQRIVSITHDFFLASFIFSLIMLLMIFLLLRIFAILRLRIFRVGAKHGS